MKEKHFKIRKKFYDVLRDMPDNQAGELIKGVCAYVYEDKPFITKDEYLRGLFVYIKRELDVSEMNRINGKIGADKLAEIRRRNAALGVIVGRVTVTSKMKEDTDKGE